MLHSVLCDYSVELGASWHPNAMSVEEFSIDEFSSEDEFMDVSDFEEDDEDDDVGAFGAFEEEQRLARQKSFTCLTSKSLEGEAVAKASHIQEVLSLPLAVVERLLFLYRWNEEKLISTYAEHSDQTLKKAGFSAARKLVKLGSTSKSRAKKKIACPVCFERVLTKDTACLPCTHRYCLDCWKTYLEMKIKEGPECLDATCINPKCEEIVSSEAVKALVSPRIFETYRKFFLRSYVNDNPKIKWCPAPDCGSAICCERRERREAVTCTCGFSFCFLCCDYDIGDHMPATCQQIEMWLQKASDESENVKWLLGNTKKCPNCRAPIEKNGGCMHMSCKKNAGGCGYEFCWLCRGPWSEHGTLTGGFYNCNKYDKSQAKKEDEKAANVKTVLETYMFYYHRYESHRNARKVADAQRRQAEQKGLELQTKFDVRSADTKFLLDATNQLLQNRKVLEFSYVYGYYLREQAVSQQERNLFEYLQEELEKHTNHLSEIYEETEVKDYPSFITWKEDVTNYTRITKKFLANFVEGVASGLTSQ